MEQFVVRCKQTEGATKKKKRKKLEQDEMEPAATLLGSGLTSDQGSGTSSASASASSSASRSGSGSGNGVGGTGRRWTAEQDQELVDAVASHGEGDWAGKAERFSIPRNGSSLRLRWRDITSKKDEQTLA